jgi:hypothetical protein
MLYKEFAPLKEDYKIITISPSELESKLVPSPFTQDDVRKRFLTLQVWHMAEAIAWATISNDTDDMAKHMCEVTRSYLNPNLMHFYSPSWKEDKKFIWLYEWLEQIIDLYRPYRNTYDLRNYRAWVEIDFSGYKILLTGELDRWINGYHLYDNKTASSKWDLDARWAVNCYQARFYSWMNMLANDINQIDFSYLITVKNKKMLLQEMTHTLTREECEEFVYDKLYQYCLWLHNGSIDDNSTAMQRM